jgi:hypothetical protein
LYVCLLELRRLGRTEQGRRCRLCWTQVSIKWTVQYTKVQWIQCITWLVAAAACIFWR